MATKREELLNPGSCFNKASLDEPVFVLRARDYHCAIPALKAWLHEARRQSKHEEKREEALNVIDLFRAYGASLEIGEFKPEAVTPERLAALMVEQFAPDMVKKMLWMEERLQELQAATEAAQAKQLEELEAARIAAQLAEATVAVVKPQPAADPAAGKAGEDDKGGAAAPA